MRSALFFTLLAFHAWVAVSLPVHWNSDETVSSHISLKYITSPTTVEERPLHFSDWLRDERKKSHISVLEAGGKAASAPSTWIERTQRTMKAWWAFYLTQYPVKSQSQSAKQSKYFTAVEMSRDRNETDSDSDSLQTQQQFEAPVPDGVTGVYMFNLSHLDPAVICNKFSPEIVGLCIFLLVPAAVMVVEVVDMLHDRWTPEQFPERGRGRVRLTGPERSITVLSNHEREKAAQHQSRKWWGHRRRST
ncbi:hypothetical protein BGW36DRAFT_364097 [Talaromyces proteolyticus]|uniref:Transmembrane protein n=1 Tax=Talaromyces proteolyticus TaxID=1131652 RepID=A0AAD4KKE1_9EURO|nr:uncharacterized protein BGW36DRAFT_364097 [Talaromyces proteolyticus]KAH8690523.1 hypothetical protein BGW36DRAFT_364097 [Talaromyces proteolyticus]